MFKFGLPEKIFEVTKACMRKDPKKEGRKLLWNLIINLATNKKYADAFVSH